MSLKSSPRRRQHHPLLVLSAGFLLAAGLCSASPASPSPSPSQSSSNTAALKGRAATACTFTAFQVQSCEAGSAAPIDFIQINEIFAPDKTVAVDVRAQRPMAAYHSFERLTPDVAWKVATLENGETLSMTLNERNEIHLAYGALQWTNADGKDGEKQISCTLDEWYGAPAEMDCSSRKRRPRKRIMQCSFLCVKDEQTEQMEL